MIRLPPALSALILIAGCSQPGFIETENVGPAPPLLPGEQIIAGNGPVLDAEAEAAREARAAALRTRAGLPAAPTGKADTDG